ncbi:YihY/virulence factor BrkB family protein [Jannaschia pohangensis]|uniref:Membrane protein n=1 Tax=Jannaschia pohangensis TaxID=390807 RepID=A0A1I3J5H8_9RHOB|nr:YihY/virulence factor BrkB family protein [Jannaschia pohangensis]SFI55356.1 membrane protein [Jannaschia pohangensis]
MSADARRLETTEEIAAREPGRGRDAARPLAIPARGWKDIFWRVKEEVAHDHVALTAAGVAFYGLLAVFPAITALMSLAGLLYDPEQVVDVLQGLTGLVPPDVAQILMDQATEVAGSQGSGLTLGFILGLSLALWSASTGVGSLIEGLNIAYDEVESRNFLHVKLLTIAFTLAMMIGLLIAVLLIVVLPLALSFMAFAPGFERGIRLVAYVPLILLFVGGLALFYRWGPDRAPARLKWLSPGTLFAVVLWLAASVGFSIYVQSFGSYNQTFGSLAGVVVLLLWLWLTAFVILLGGELNAEIEAQTARDTTTGPREPMGHRNAVKADTLGPAQ